MLGCFIRAISRQAASKVCKWSAGDQGVDLDAHAVTSSAMR